jgi:4-cresol dehydrogenase (hydroxylating)
MTPSPAAVAAFLDAGTKIVGAEHVLRTAADLSPYQDQFAFAPPGAHAPGGVVAPESVEQIQALLKLANEKKVPLWPVSRGKNLGYGGAAPVVSGSVILDLSRMRRILHVDEKLAYCVVEPGVGFFDLQDYLDANGIKLWLGAPGQSWGSVLGNALEHGGSTTPLGEHASQICGMEVLLANGDIVRTGMGAMTNGAAWNLYKHAFGPGWDQMFTQSNFGIVTKLGLWLLPEPEATLQLKMEVDEVDALEWIVDSLGPLRTNGTLNQFCAIRNYMGTATRGTQRKDWYAGSGAMPDSVIDTIKQQLKVGWWDISLRLHGVDGANRANAEAIQRAVSKHTDLKFEITTWKQGEPREKSGQPRATMNSMHKLNWPGGRGGFLAFSPVMPLNGKLALEQFRRTRERMKEFGFDYYGAVYLAERALMVVSEVFFDQDDADQIQRLRKLFPVLVADAKAQGYGEYRGHIAYMDEIAGAFDFNHHALRRLNERVKDTLDPNGILAPGKQGIWPRGRRPVGQGPAITGRKS